MDWTPQSPDLNITEAVWRQLGREQKKQNCTKSVFALFTGFLFMCAPVSINMTKYQIWTTVTINAIVNSLNALLKTGLN